MNYSLFGQILIIHRLIMTKPAVRDIVISLAATYGLYFVSSFLHFEPWHMFTSFIREYSFWIVELYLIPCLFRIHVLASFMYVILLCFHT